MSATDSAEIVIYVGGHDPLKLEKTAATLEALGIRAVAVHSSQMSPGWKGCCECHRLMAERALQDGQHSYISMEQNVIPALRYDEQTIRDALHVVRTGKAPLVHLSCMPTPGGLRYSVHGSVMGKVVSKQDLAQCMVLRQGVIQEALQLKKPIDSALAQLGYMKHVVYPTPFQRDHEVSIATPVYNRSGVKWLRQFAFTPTHYRNLEVIAQYDVFGVFVLIILILGITLLTYVVVTRNIMFHAHEHNRTQTEQ